MAALPEMDLEKAGYVGGPTQQESTNDCIVGGSQRDLLESS